MRISNLQVIHKYRLLILLMLILIIIAAPSFAWVESYITYDSLLAKSDLIVIIKPASVIDGTCLIEKVIKGDKGLTGVVIQIHSVILEPNNHMGPYPDPIVRSAFIDNSRILVYLQKSTSGNNLYNLTDYYHGGFRVRDIRPKEPSDNAINDELLNEALSTDYREVDDAINWIMRSNSKTGMDLIDKRCNEKNTLPPILAYKLKREVSGKKEYIKQVIGFIDQCDNAITEDHKVFNHYDAMRWYNWEDSLILTLRQIASTDDVPYLNSLILSRRDNIQRMLIYSSRNWADNTSLPVLMKILHESDSDLQYFALITLSKLTGKDIPSFNKFQTDKEKVINDWLNWWKTAQR